MPTVNLLQCSTPLRTTEAQNRSLVRTKCANGSLGGRRCAAGFPPTKTLVVDVTPPKRKVPGSTLAWGTLRTPVFDPDLVLVGHFGGPSVSQTSVLAERSLVCVTHFGSVQSRTCRY